MKNYLRNIMKIFLVFIVLIIQGCSFVILFDGIDTPKSVMSGPVNDYSWVYKEVGGNELQIYMNGNEVAAFHRNSGYLRMVHANWVNWGTSVIVTPCFWTGGKYYQGMSVTTVQYMTNSNCFAVEFNGSLAGLTANGVIVFSPPTITNFIANVSVKVTGSVPLDGSRPGEAFKPVMLSSMHVSSTYWDCSSASNGNTSSSIPSSSWIFSTSTTGNKITLEGGTNLWKAYAPSVDVLFDRSLNTVGWVTASGNPNDDNVGFWLGTTAILTNYSFVIQSRFNKVVTPQATPASGTFANGVVVSLASTPGAAILWSTNQAVSWNTGSVVTLSNSAVLLAKGTLSGFLDSDISTNVYTIVDKETVIIISPTNNANVASNFTISGIVLKKQADFEGVYLSVDSGSANKVNGAENWDTNLSLSPGNHVIQVSSKNTAGSVVSTASNKIFVSPTIPIVNITSPTDGQSIRVNCTVSGTAVDANGITGVYLSTDGGPYWEVSGTTSWSMGLLLSGGAHTLKAYAVNGYGIQGETKSVNITAYPDEAFTWTVTGTGTESYDELPAFTAGGYREDSVSVNHNSVWWGDGHESTSKDIYLGDSSYNADPLISYDIISEAKDNVSRTEFKQYTDHLNVFAEVYYTMTHGGAYTGWFRVYGRKLTAGAMSDRSLNINGENAGLLMGPAPWTIHEEYLYPPAGSTVYSWASGVLNASDANDAGTYIDYGNNRLVIRVNIRSGGTMRIPDPMRGMPFFVFVPVAAGHYEARYYLYAKVPRTQTVTKTVSALGSVNKLDGTKTISSFDAVPSPTKGGTVSGVTYTIGNNNGNVDAWISGNNVMAKTKY